MIVKPIIGSLDNSHKDKINCYIEETNVFKSLETSTTGAIN